VELKRFLFSPSFFIGGLFWGGEKWFGQSNKDKQD